MITKMNKIFSFTVLIFLASCSLSPGMNMESDASWISPKNDFVLVGKEEKKKIFIKELTFETIKENSYIKTPYKIGIGDKLSVVVWGLPEVFPMVNMTSDQALRVVNTDGTIFFPYAGSVKALGLTQVELRDRLTDKLSKNFKDPQLDVSIARFESQRVYLIGEVTSPQKLNITETPLSLADALGQVRGLNTNTSAADQVFVIRQAAKNKSNEAQIFRADLSNPAYLLLAGEFYLAPQDIIYVNAKGTTRWNRVISQFFPFSSFLNSLDNLAND